jgi:hypothetical protein
LRERRESMAWEYEGLFDAIPTDHDLLSEYWRSEATATRIGAMGYRTRTIKAGTRLEAEVYPIYGRSQEQAARRGKQNLTPERQSQLNVRRAKRRLILLMEENFRAEEDSFVTLTYAEEPTMQRCRKDVRNFLNRVKRLREKKGLPELKYIYAIGHDKDQRIHVHAVTTGGITQKELVKLWGKGIVNSYLIQSYGKGLQGLANYLYKQNEKAKDAGERAHVHMWCGSRNLKYKLKEHVSDTKMSNRKVKKIALSFGTLGREIMERTYPGYVLEDCRVMFSDVVDGAYIRCVMRKKEEDYGQFRKKQKRLEDAKGPSGAGGVC